MNSRHSAQTGPLGADIGCDAWGNLAWDRTGWDNLAWDTAALD
jgi:hypothetical protein